jgi:hypothetical protein
MQLPKDILENLNLAISRHKDPASLDWQLIKGKWTAREGNRQFQIIHDEKFGCVIAETRSTCCKVGADLH